MSKRLRDQIASPTSFLAVFKQKKYCLSTPFASAPFPPKYWASFTPKVEPRGWVEGGVDPHPLFLHSMTSILDCCMTPFTDESDPLPLFFSSAILLKSKCSTKGGWLPPRLHIHLRGWKIEKKKAIGCKAAPSFWNVCNRLHLHLTQFHQFLCLFVHTLTTIFRSRLGSCVRLSLFLSATDIAVKCV